MVSFHVLCVVAASLLVSQARRTAPRPIYGELTEIHDLDCTTANRADCQAKCNDSTNCAVDMVDRAQIRKCWLDLGEECSVEATLYRRTNRTGEFVAGTSTNLKGPTIKSHVQDIVENGHKFMDPKYFASYLRIYTDNARACDGVSTQGVVAVGGPSGTPKTVIATAIADDCLELDFTQVFTSVTATGLAFEAEPLVAAGCFTLEDLYNNKTMRVEQFYKSLQKYKVYGTDTLNHLSLYEA